MTTNCKNRTYTGHIFTCVLALMLLASSAQALTLNTSFLQGGIGTGKIEGDTNDADVTIYGGLVNVNVHKSEIVGLDVRGSYYYGDVQGSLGGSMKDSDLDLIVSLPSIPIVKPFGIAGVSYDKFSLNHNFGPEHGWDFGYNLGLGAEVFALPNLPITGIIRYTHGDVETVEYMVDATLWLGKFGIGANLVYQDGTGDNPNNVKQGNLYVAFKF